MIITNKYNLPDPICRAIENDPYDSGDCDISTTRLINPPQIVTLTERHHDLLEEDVSERIWSLLGQSIHVILERAANGNTAEKRYFADMDGWRVSGAIDLLDNRTLADYKVTSAWTYIYKSRMEEWTAQGNVNHWIYHKNGGEVDALKNILFLRDWAPSKATKGGNYPQIQVVTVDLPLWPIEQAEQYVRDRVALHKYARTMQDAQLPRCSDEDRWLNRGEPKRCLAYCPVRRVCQQHKEYLQKIDA